ncbi:ubiquitin-protein transferase [Fragilaria crotonensis]|nr:ubiquitin-protein transferase [Fragilaria crotonensis]
MTLGRRPLVLAALFPNEARVEAQGTTGGLSLKYDPQSKQYVFSEDTPDANSCSICLEILAPEDDTVTGLCSHVYHRDCIMNWFQDYHDECPNCRQPMWDPETYNMIDQIIQDQENSGP